MCEVYGLDVGEFGSEFGVRSSESSAFPNVHSKKFKNFLAAEGVTDLAVKSINQLLV